MAKRARATVLLLGIACGDGEMIGSAPATTFGSGAPAGTSGETSHGSEASTESGDPPAEESEAEGSSSSGSSSGDGPGCTFCDAENQMCVDDECITTCQGQVPDPCGPDQVCDVMSGECRAPDATCTLTGQYVECGASRCGPGSVCDDQGECIAYPPCAGVTCLEDGTCWGTYCSCERAIDCEPAPIEDLNDVFASQMSDLAFADDCTAWMVTLRSGADVLRRLSPDSELTVWTGVANLNMGEVAVLTALTPPPAIGIEPGLTHDSPPTPPQTIEGNGEVALTYICCSTCGCQANPPQGVARLDEDGSPALPLVIAATPTSASGPFGSVGADAGPFGLTWGADRVLYVGNSAGNGTFHSADLEAETQAQIFAFEARVTATAPLTPTHLLVALIGGAIYRFNVIDGSATMVADVDQDVTSLAFDAFTGLVHAGLRDFQVVTVHPFTGDVQPFAMMPARGRVTVSPNGQLWHAPLGGGALSAWELPVSF